MQDRGLARLELQVHPDPTLHGFQVVPTGGIELRLPVLVPDTVPVRCGAGPSDAVAVDTLGEVVALATNISDRQVCYEKIANCPPRRICRFALNADAEES
jgi:hypothetical protein